MKYKIIEGPAARQGSPEWLAYRATKITASETSAIIGVSPWCSAHQLWQQKMGLSERIKTTSAMQRGTDLEPIARATFEATMNLKMIPVVIEDLERPWLAASLDGLSYCQRYAVEIKCPGTKSHAEALQGVIPSVYRAQLQTQIEILGLDEIYYYSFDGRDGIVITVPRDQEYIDAMLPKLEEFHRKLSTFEEPELTDRDFDLRNEDIWLNYAREYKEAQLAEKLACEKKEFFKKELVLMADGQNSRGGGIKVRFTSRRGNVVYRDIPNLKGVDLEQYRGKPIKIERIEND